MFSIITQTENFFNDLGVDNIGGVFVVLLCGLAFAILVAILEFCWNSKKNAQNERQSLCSEMAEELRFAIRCHGSRQRPALKRNCVKCSPAGQHTYVPSSFALPHHFAVICISNCIMRISSSRISTIFYLNLTARDSISKRDITNDGIEEV